jgi:hypothetical protein
VSELPISPHAEIGELAIQSIESVAVIDRWLPHGCAPLSNHESLNSQLRGRWVSLLSSSTAVQVDSNVNRFWATPAYPVDSKWQPE